MRRSELDTFFIDFMDALTDYGCEVISRAEFRKVLEDLHDTYKYYPTTEIMYKATIQRLTSCGRASKEKDTNLQCKRVNQELDIVKHPPKIIF